MSAPSSAVTSRKDMLCKVIGRVLTAGLCIFMWYQSLKGRWEDASSNKNGSHLFRIITATTAALIFGVGCKVADLTQEHGLRVSTSAENAYYFLVGLSCMALITTQTTFMAYIVVHHGLVKGKIDTPKNLLTAIAVYGLWVWLLWTGSLDIDWLFVSVSVGANVLWILLKDLLCLGDTWMHRYSMHMILLMADLVAFDRERFIAPALIMILEVMSYATTNVFARSRPWYVKSKAESRAVAKNHLSIEIFTVFGCVHWLLAYAVMLWEGVWLKVGPWPVQFGTYWLVWEFLDSCLDHFNRGEYTRKGFQKPKRILCGCCFVMDFALHFLFVLYGESLERDDITGVEIPQSVPGRCLYIFVHVAVWMLLFKMGSYLGMSRGVKYSGYAMQLIQHVATLRLPVYHSSPLLATAAWITVLGNLCYVPKIWSPTLPKPRIVYSVFSVMLVVLGVVFNIFSREVYEIPFAWHSLIASMWFIFVTMISFVMNKQ